MALRIKRNSEAPKREKSTDGRAWSRAPVTNYLEWLGISLHQLQMAANIKFGAFLFFSGAFDQILSSPAFGTFCCKNWTIFHNI